MDNEKLILEALTSMQGQMNDMQREISGLHEEIQAVRTDLHEEIQAQSIVLHAEIQAVHDEVVKTNIKIENDIEPKLNALWEGQQLIMQTYAKNERVERLENVVLPIGKKAAKKKS